MPSVYNSARDSTSYVAGLNHEKLTVSAQLFRDIL